MLQSLTPVLSVTHWHIDKTGLVLKVDHSKTKMPAKGMNFNSVFNYYLENWLEKHDVPFKINEDKKIKIKDGELWTITVPGKEVSDIEYFIKNL